MWRTHFLSDPPYVVKLVPLESEEAEIYEQLHKLDPASPNHTLPCDVIRTDTEQPFLIMPCLEKIHQDLERRRWGVVPLLEYFHQVIEVSHARRRYRYSGPHTTRTQGIEFLHNLRIAHMVSAK